MIFYISPLIIYSFSHTYAPSGCEVMFDCFLKSKHDNIFIIAKSTENYKAINLLYMFPGKREIFTFDKINHLIS